jgi:hypothetical protein
MLNCLNPAAKVLADIGAYFGEAVPVSVNDLNLLRVDHDKADLDDEPQLDAAGLAKASADIAGYLSDGTANKGSEQARMSLSKFDTQVLNYFGRGA